MFKVQVSGFHVPVASPFLWLRRFKVSMATPFLCLRRLKLFLGFSGYAVSMLRVSKKKRNVILNLFQYLIPLFFFCFWLAPG